MTETEFLHQQIRDVIDTLRKFHVPGGEQYDEDNPVDVEYLANHLEALITTVLPKKHDRQCYYASTVGQYPCNCN